MEGELTVRDFTGCWKCVSLDDSLKNAMYCPEKIFIEIRKVKIYGEEETQIDIVDYNESLLIKGKIISIKYNLMAVDVSYPEKIKLQIRFLVIKKRMYMKFIGKEGRILKMVLSKEDEHLF